MKIQTVWPNTIIDTAAEIYIVYDHMTHVDITGCHSKTYEQIELELFGKNNYLLPFEISGKSIDEKFFIFGTYLQLDRFTDRNNVIFLPLEFYKFIKISTNSIDANTLDFNKKTVVANCQMRNQRYNRILASCWFYNNQDWLNIKYTQSWISEDKEALLFELLKLGKLATWEGSQYQIKNLDKNYIEYKHAVRNTESTMKMYFDNQQYNSMFRQSAVSIILGATFFEYGCDIDEKYLTAIYGGTIPLHDGYGFYDAVKKLGFDTFDDVVDTSSQYEKNPCIRTWNTLEKNRHLLENGLDYMQRPDIQQRILNNLELAKNPNKCLCNAFKNLNTLAAQHLYLEKYQTYVSSIDPEWPMIDLQQ